MNWWLFALKAHPLMDSFLELINYSLLEKWFDRWLDYSLLIWTPRFRETSPPLHSIQRDVVELDKLAGIDLNCGRECCGQKANTFPAEIIRQHHFGNPTDCWCGYAAMLCLFIDWIEWLRGDFVTGKTLQPTMIHYVSLSLSFSLFLPLGRHIQIDQKTQTK